MERFLKLETTMIADELSKAKEYLAQTICVIELVVHRIEKVKNFLLFSTLNDRANETSSKVKSGSRK